MFTESENIRTAKHRSLTLQCLWIGHMNKIKARDILEWCVEDRKVVIGLEYGLLIVISKSIIFRSLKKTCGKLKKCQRFKFCSYVSCSGEVDFYVALFLMFHQLGWLCHKSVFLLENIGFGRLQKVYMLLHILTRLWKSLATVVSKWRKSVTNNFERQTKAK